MGAALKPRPRVTRWLRRSVGAAAAVAEALLERRRPAVTRRLTSARAARGAAAAGLFVRHRGRDGDPRRPRRRDASTAVLLTLSYALMRRVRFPLGPGLIRPTQLVFVPMLFLTPAAAVPLLVALGSMLGELPDLLRRRAHPERLR